MISPQLRKLQLKEDFLDALYANDFARLEKSIEMGADPRTLARGKKETRLIHKEDPYTEIDPMDFVIKNGFSESCGVLLRNGFDTRTDNARDQTMLHKAAEMGHADICALLIDHGSDVNAKFYEHENKPRVDRRYREGWTALHLAAARERIDTCELLIAREANINAVDDQGHTPFYVATLVPAIQTAFVLGAHGANTLSCSDQFKSMEVFRGAQSLSIRQCAAMGEMKEHLFELFEQLPTLKPGNSPEELAEFAKLHGKAEFAGVIEAYIAAKAINAMLENNRIDGLEGLDGLDGLDKEHEARMLSSALAAKSVLDQEPTEKKFLFRPSAK